MNTLEPFDAPSVETTVNYLMFDGTRPVINAPTGPENGVQTNIDPLPTRVRIHDGRQHPLAPTLDRNGFQLLRAPSEVREFSDEARIRDVYYRESQLLLMAATGASKVVVFDHALRLDAAERAKGVAEPVRQVHCDQTPVSGPRRVRDHLPPPEAELRLQGRCAIINLWRPIGSPVMTSPLALCDARSIAPNDVVATQFVNAGRVGEVALFRANRDHRWFYFPQMTPDEVILIKIYDSLEDGTARLSAHTAFDDPTSPAGAPPRRSIELRALVFWD
jgi:hypothetical protein